MEVPIQDNKSLKTNFGNKNSMNIGSNCLVYDIWKAWTKFCHDFNNCES